MRRKVIAVAVVILLTYTALFISGECYQFRLFTTNETLHNQTITFNGPYNGAAGRESNATLRDSDGRTFFFYPFTLAWLPFYFGNYTGQVLFVGHAPTCPGPGLTLHSLDIAYKSSYNERLGVGPPELLLDPLDFTSWHPTVVADTPFPDSVVLSYTGLQGDQCTLVPLEFVAIAFPETVMGVHYQTFPYNFTMEISATLYGTNASAAPFIGQSYSGTISIPIDVSANGTVTMGSLAP
jgi:hypothetical protein